MGKKEKLSEYEYNKVSIPNELKEKQELPLQYGYGVRHIQIAIVLACMTTNFVARGHMGVTVVAMTSEIKENESVIETNITINPLKAIDLNIHVIPKNNRMIDKLDDDNTTARATSVQGSVESSEKSYETYPWPKSTQEMVLGAFFLGYCIATLPMGLITQRWGGKIPMQVALLVNGIVNILAPWLTKWGGWKALCGCRILQGLSQAGVYPSIQTLVAKWVPENERGTLSSFVYTGSTIGTVVAFQLGGFLGDSRLGWPLTFWTVGAICLIVLIIMTVFGAASPAEHKTISEEEKMFILGRVDDGINRRPPTPWKAILTSRSVWGSLATHAGSGVAFVFFFTQVPSYIHYILGIDLRSSGVLSSLPYVASFFTSVSFGLISDFCTNRKIISVKNSRRMFNTISQTGIAVSLVCASFTTSTVIAVACLVLAMGMHMGVHVGWMVNHIDLAPNFSGTLMMIGNVLMNILNVLLPILVSNIVTDVTNQIQWRIMICIIASVAITSNIIFVVLMSADTEPWNDIYQNEIYLDDIEAKEKKEAN